MRWLLVTLKFGRNTTFDQIVHPGSRLTISPDRSNQADHHFAR